MDLTKKQSTEYDKVTKVNEKNGIYLNTNFLVLDRDTPCFVCIDKSSFRICKIRLLKLFQP